MCDLSPLVISIRLFLENVGFCWNRSWCNLFLSTLNCASTFHSDATTGIIIQLSGDKVFYSLRYPERFHEMNDNLRCASMEELPQFEADDVMADLMHPGDIHWSNLVTPHWVKSISPIALSLRISFENLMIE